ncbi:MAG TPA: helicase C-terminal domain-containing protein, partial [Limnochordia bacterium]|nr:helicase C-terminal domain-containing protein [Limnochordia bacterium]
MENSVAWQPIIARGLPLDLDLIRAVYAPGGPLAEALSGYEARPQQALMALEVARQFNDGGVTLIEAGTGTGKSLAYLVPAALYALAGGRRVVVATQTINLQEQLLHKDMPVLSERLGLPVKAALVKGWGNYLCRLRLERALAAPGDLFEAGAAAALYDLAEWSETTEDGSLSAWDAPLPEGVWDEVAAESDACVRQECPHFGDCFFFKARRAVQEAHLLIVNHHLLFADIALRKALGWRPDAGVLPEYAHVIFDEAHHIEDVATDHFGLRVSQLGIARLLGRVHRQGRGGARGLVPALARLGGEHGWSEAEHARLEALAAATGDVRFAGDAYFEPLRSGLRREEGRVALPARTALDPAAWPDDEPPRADALCDALEGLAAGLDDLAKLVAARLPRPSALAHGSECDAAAARARLYAQALKLLDRRDDPEFVYWFEANRNRGVSLEAAPIHVGEALIEWLEAQLRGAAMTSATLTVERRFDFTCARLGLAGRDVRTLALDSPFDYAQQALLACPDDVPDPAHPRFARALVERLPRLIAATAGRMFVLFTSYQQMREVYGALEGELLADGYTPLLHGTRPRHALIERFKASPGAVLFGTDSFWEGVDVPGAALSCVVLVKLPFAVPTDPVI